MLLFAELLLAEVMITLTTISYHILIQLQVFLLAGVTIIDQSCPQRLRVT